MKKFLLILAALVMLMTGIALADAKVDNVTKMKDSVSLCRYSNNYIARTEGGYCLYDINGNVLSAVYKDMRPAESGQYLKVQNVGSSTNINCQGLLDSMGREILPMAYGSIVTYHGDGWVLGHVLSPSTTDVGEYSDNKGNKYIISRTDVVYNGQVIGSLGREDFQGSYTVTVRGPSMFVKITSQKGYWLTSDFSRKDVTADSYVDTAEYASVYKGPVTHSPTQQQAFTAGCTLTRDQVEQHIWYDSARKQVLDLQGNVLADNLNYDSVWFRDNYMEIETDSYRHSGVMTFDGQVIIPAQYAEVARYVDGYFASGYNAVLDDNGNLYYYDETGKLTASAEYQLSRNDYKGFGNNAPIICVKNMGKYMIITATHGTLAETYNEALTCGEYQRVIAVKKGDYWGVIDMAGNTVVPFEYPDSPEISHDGTAVYARKNYGEYDLYRLSYTEQGAPENTWTETVQSGETETSAPVLAEGAWVCTCGAINTGKFCGECGTKKPEPTPTPAPAASEEWVCTCGAINSSKFCGECGSKRPEVKICPSCGYQPEDQSSKFCSECGTKY